MQNEDSSWFHRQEISFSEIAERKQQQLILWANKIPFSAYRMKMTTAISTGKKDFSFWNYRMKMTAALFTCRTRFLFQHAEWRQKLLFLQARRISLAEWWLQLILWANQIVFSARRMKVTTAVSTGKKDFLYWNCRMKAAQLLLWANEILFSACRMTVTAFISTGKKDFSFRNCRMKTTATTFSECRMKTAADYTDKKDFLLWNCRRKTTAATFVGK